ALGRIVLHGSDPPVRHIFIFIRLALDSQAEVGQLRDASMIDEYIVSLDVLVADADLVQSEHGVDDAGDPVGVPNRVGHDLGKQIVDIKRVLTTFMNSFLSMLAQSIFRFRFHATAPDRGPDAAKSWEKLKQMPRAELRAPSGAAVTGLSPGTSNSGSPANSWAAKSLRAVPAAAIIVARLFTAYLLHIRPSCLVHPEVQRHSRLILVATLFCLVGAVLIASGLLSIVPEPHPLFGIVFVAGGFVIFIPGIYYVTYVIRAYLGHDGYLFDHLPSMD
uniref:Transmembrane protein 230 n=1 Tax=Macrostomum lignano TaxID=282301 RepID=A0A1I8FU11_9PLAT